MPSTEFSEARGLLDEIESRWISLLLWLSATSGIGSEALVSGLGDPGTDAITNYEARRRAVPTGQFTPLHFLQFPQYVELAQAQQAALQALGNPPTNWIRQLNQQNQTAITYRNDLQHAGRFDLLSPADRQEAVTVFRQQRDALRQWWPEHPYRPQKVQIETNKIRAALQMLSRDERSAVALAEELGFRAITAPVNLLPPGAQTDLARTLGADFGRLYRVGQKPVANASAGLYLAYLSDWPERSAARERYRRRLARALTLDGSQDARFLVVMIDDNAGTGDSRRNEIEIVYPRQRSGRPFGTVRAVIEPDRPTRYHIELFNDLNVEGLTSIQQIVHRWNGAFNVERVTDAFYKEFKELRDQIGRALLEQNADHPVLEGWSVADLTAKQPSAVQRERQFKVNAFATRQLSRLLFLWFLQQKGWLGSDGIPGPRTFMVDLFRARPKPGDTYYAEVLVPLFFDALGEPAHDERHRAAELALNTRAPYIDGGLFRADADPFERSLFGIGDDNLRTMTIGLPDALFDPARDNPELTTARRAQTRSRTILGLLRSYRFTTQESTPDDQSVDPDPELLGKVFENLYQEDDRHETGAYYTPREIVRYMCRHALDGYLRDRTGVAQETIDGLRREAIDWQETALRLTAAGESALTEALDDVTAVDPAVGSGAFLVGMLQEIVLLRRGVRSATIDANIDRGSELVYDWKRHAITHSLYGVDINSAAVEICRLRLWLSLVIEYDVARLSDIHPLPNLEFRVVAGDSLVDRMGVRPFIHSLPLAHVQTDFETERKFRELSGLVSQYNEADVRARATRLRTLAERIRALQLEIAAGQLDAAVRDAETALNRVQTAARPTQNAVRNAERHLDSLKALQAGLQPNAPFLKPLLWPLVFPTVFENGGFDIVVANPPYVRQENLSPIDQESYAAAFAGAYAGTADLYVFFFARAVQLLKQGGWLSYITSNKYMRANYGEKLREFLPKNLQVEQVIDFGDLPVFSVAAYPAVFIGKKDIEPNPEGFVAVADLSVPIRKQLKDEVQTVNTEHVRSGLQELNGLIGANAAPGFPQVLLRKGGWILEDPTLVRLFERLMNTGTPLGQYVNGRIYYGIKTGLNDAFVIDQTKRDELVAADPRSAELIKPWLRGGDIKRWTPKWAGLYVIFTRRGIAIQNYPAVHEHLLQWREALQPKQPGEPRMKKGRKPGDYQWYEIQDNVAYYRDFDVSKIVWPRNTPPWEARFAVDDTGSYVNDKGYIIPGGTENLCRYLNSPVIYWLLDKMTTKLRGGYLELKSDNVVIEVPIAEEMPLLNSRAPRDLLDETSEVLHVGPNERELIWEWYQARQVYEGPLDAVEDLDD